MLHCGVSPDVEGDLVPGISMPGAFILAVHFFAACRVRVTFILAVTVLVAAIARWRIAVVIEAIEATIAHTVCSISEGLVRDANTGSFIDVTRVMVFKFFEKTNQKKLFERNERDVSTNLFRRTFTNRKLSYPGNIIINTHIFTYLPQCSQDIRDHHQPNSRCCQ